MKKPTFHRSRKALAALSVLCFFAGSSAWATVVIWNLNPSASEGAVGSTSKTFTSSGYSITANGYAVGWPTHTPLGLYYKNQGGNIGLGITSTSDHELQGNGLYPTQFIQFDVSSIIDQGFTNGKLQIGSVSGSSNDTFVIWGSSKLGDAGSQIGGVYTSSSNLLFVNIAEFASYDFISIGALSGGVLPVGFQATLAPVPEISALFPIVGLVAAIATTQILRRRRIAQLRAGGPSSGGH
ncbi:MAG: hypothetical protein H0W43_10055 [Chthoniobacterales bacterium]|nr:hypothetical protein [Chthoniobacterales bacterium]